MAYSIDQLTKDENKRNSLVTKQNQVLATPQIPQGAVATTQLGERPLNNITTNANYAKDLAIGQRNATINRQLASVMETPTTPQNQAAKDNLVNSLNAQKQGTTAQAAMVQKAQANLPAPVAPTLSSSGLTVNQPRSFSLSSTTTAPSPVNPMVKVDPRGANSQFVSGGNSYSDSQFTPDIEAYMKMSPDQQLQYQSMAVQEGGRRRLGMQNELFDYQKQLLDQRQSEEQTKYDAEKKRIEEENAAAQKLFEEQQAADVARASQQVQRVADQRADTAATNLAFSGFGRSTKAAEIQDSIRQDTQAQITDINRQSQVAMNEYKASVLDKTNAKLEQLQAKVEKYGDAKDALELDRMKSQQDLIMDLFKQDPLSPENMIATAEKLQSQRLAQQKLDQEEKKALRDEAQKNFQFMVTNFGSEYFRNLDPESAANLAANIGVPASMIQSMGKTIKEQENEWDKLKYFDGQNFDLMKMQAQNDMALARDAMGFDRDLQKIAINLQNDVAMEQFKSQLASEKDMQKRNALLTSLGIQTAQYATNANKASLFFDQPIPHPANGQPVSALNTSIAQAYPDGFKFKAAAGSLLGQCKWFAQQLTQFPDGSSWKAGSTLADTQKSFENYRKQGKAFRVGEGEVVPGMSVLSSDSKTYGHGYVINAIRPDGKWVVTESNYAGPLQVTNNRVVDPNDPKVIGVLKTVPKPQYQVPQKAVSALGSALNSLTNGPIKGLLGGVPKTISSAASASFDDQQAAKSKLTDDQMRGISALSATDKSLLMQNAPEVYRQFLSQGGEKKTPEKRPVEQTVALTLSKFRDVSEQLEDIEAQYNKLSSADPITGEVRIRNPYDTDVQQLNRMITAVVPTLARGVFGEVGVLTDSDVERYTKLLADARTPKNQADQAMAFLKNRVSGSYKNYINTFGDAGYDISGFDPSGLAPQQSDPLGIDISTANSDPLGIF